MSYLNDPEHWRGRAEEARAMAAQMRHPDAKSTMLDIAKGYETLAKQVDGLLVKVPAGLSKSKPD